MRFNIFTPHDFVSKLIGSLTGKKVETLQAQYVNETKEQFMRLTDLTDKTIPSRKLANVSKKMGDWETLGKMGAQQDDDGNWYVPDNVELTDAFKPWFPLIPKDLDDEMVMCRSTADGLPWEKFVTADDVISAGDSTATPIVMGMFPVFAALTLFGLALIAFMGVVGAVVGTVLVLGSWAGVAIHAMAMWRGEDWQESFKMIVKGYLVPLVISLYVSAISFATAGMKGSASQVANFLPSTVPAFAREFVMSLAQATASTVMFMVFAVAVLFLWNIMKVNPKQYGGFFEAFRQDVIGAFTVAGVLFLALMVPLALAPAVVFAFVCLSPVWYTEMNFRHRALVLHQQDRIIGGINDYSEFKKRKEFRSRMLANAMNDNTPRIPICIPQGYMANKQLRNSPDAGNTMYQSIMDLLKHTVVFGKTGVGKTNSYAKNIAFQLAKLSAQGHKIGMLALCGKGALPSDIEKFLDFNIKPGLPVGLLEGLSPQDVASALNSQRAEEEVDYWVITSSMATIVICNLAWALNRQAVEISEQFKKDIETEFDFLMTTKLKLRLIETKMIPDPNGNEASIRANMALQEQMAQLRKEIALSEKRVAFATDYLKSGKKWAWTFDNLEIVKDAFVNDMKKVTTAEEGDTYVPVRMMKEIINFLGVDIKGYPDSKFPTYSELKRHNSEINKALVYWNKTWCPQAEDTRNSVAGNINALFNPLSQATNLVDANGDTWSSLETGVDVSKVLEGQRIGLALKEEIYGECAKVIALLLKQRVYTNAKKRAIYGSNWADHIPNSVNTFCFMDEAHILLGNEERKFASVSRSSGFGFFFMAQDYNSFRSAFHNNEAETNNFLDLPQSLVCFECSSAETYKWIENRVGKAYLLRQDPSQFGLDYQKGFQMYATSVLNMDDHPTASFNNHLKQLGMTKVVARSMFNNSDEPRDRKWGKMDGTNVNSAFAPIHTAILAGSQGTLKEDFIVSATELNEELRDAGYTRAFVLLHRAGAARIDFAEPLGMDPRKEKAALAEIERITMSKLVKDAERSAAKMEQQLERQLVELQQIQQQQ